MVWDNTCLIPESIFCGEKLNNVSIILSKLKRYLSKNIPHCQAKILNISVDCWNKTKIKDYSELRQFMFRKKVQETSYKVAEFTVKAKRPHTQYLKRCYCLLVQIWWK